MSTGVDGASIVGNGRVGGVVVDKRAAVGVDGAAVGVDGIAVGGDGGAVGELILRML